VPGYHMNKRHWNSVEITDGVSDRLIRTWIKDSYLLVVAGLKKEQREMVRKSLEEERMTDDD
ncbi:MAG: MmcQ/YjbR family DNA-binding protein, partial [Bacteroidales bacterium]